MDISIYDSNEYMKFNIVFDCWLKQFQIVKGNCFNPQFKHK